MTEIANIEITLKIIILGSSSVGKECILNNYFKEEFKGPLLSSIGIDFKTKYFKFDEEKVKVNYIDTAGQEKFKAISLNYLKGSDGAVLVFDITKKKTFELIGNWLDDIRENNKMNVAKLLVGNKADLENEREVTKQEAEKLAEMLQCKYYETSAKTGANINEALDEIAKVTYTIWKTNENRHSIRISSADSITKPSIVQKKGGCC